MSFYQRVLRPMLFRLDPETAHRWTVSACGIAGRIPPVRLAFRRFLECRDSRLQTNVGGLRLNNPVGLAAGWDKSGLALKMLGHLGFGFAEIGSVSADASSGNPRPRLFRLPHDRAIVVYYGLPNDGAAIVARRLARSRRADVPVGVNLVKTNRGPDGPADDDDAILDDYVRSVAQVQKGADYLALNLSCPNAKGGKDFFAEPTNVRRLMSALATLGISRPLFLKIAPTDDPAILDGLLDAVADCAFVSGFIFNLAPGKPPWLSLTTPRSVWEKWPGAVSGQPVRDKMNSCIRALYRRMPASRYAIVGVGGIFTAEDAYQKIKLGASAVQLYTAMIYEGPGVVRRINEGLAALLARDGCSSVREAVGVDARNESVHV